MKGNAMTMGELEERLHPNHFEPFEITMNNGERFRVLHSKLALLADTGVLYIYEPSHKGFHVTGPAIVCAIHNISSLEPLGQAA